MDFKDEYLDKIKIIFVINDLFGKRFIKIEECDYWSEYEIFIKGCLINSCLNFLMIC